MTAGEARSFWQLRFPLPTDAVDEVLTSIDADADSFAAYEAEDGSWYCEILSRQPPDAMQLAGRLREILAEETPPLEAFVVERLAGRDWLEATKRSFPARRIGRFWVHGSHVEDAPPTGTLPLLIDAGTAFGSGEHGSTMGCLEAIDRLARQRRFSRILDMGCGSAILAIAALKCWPGAKALACDIDPGSIDAARANALRNGVAARLETLVADGYARPVRRRAGRFDLVLANILAGPLTDMAADLARSLRPRGHAVLAGLLTTQAPLVVQAHRHQGLSLVVERRIGPWATLVLRRAAGRPGPSRVQQPNPFGVERWPVAPA